MLTDREIKEIYGKSIFDMTVAELAENHLVDTWADMVDEYADEISDEYEED